MLNLMLVSDDLEEGQGLTRILQRDGRFAVSRVSAEDALQMSLWGFAVVLWEFTSRPDLLRRFLAEASKPVVLLVPEESREIASEARSLGAAEVVVAEGNYLHVLPECLELVAERLFPPPANTLFIVRPLMTA